MVPPSQRRKGKPRGGVIQIWTTRACDKCCFGCTQGSNLAGKPGFITPEQFEQACISLEDYFGIVGVFGGNPCVHPQFDQLCNILAKYIPFERRGLWASKLFGHGEICRKTFNPAVSNLNAHLDREAYEEFKRDWPGCGVFGLNDDSRHSPPYIAMQDLIADEEKRWELISNCDINQHWSAMICVVRGELRGFFCEIAGAMAMLHQDDPDWPDMGVPVDENWWRKGMDAFANQARHYCHACGVPLRAYGELAQAADGTEYVSATHADIYRPKQAGRRVKIIRSLDEIGSTLGRSTKYLQNAKA
jgi:hypothetical protein